jgi:fluoride exporter
MIYLVIAAGGALGALARYALGGWVHSWAGAALPWGTLAANVLGAILLGLTVRLAQQVALSPNGRAFLAIGFCGAFTTFSTFSYETVALLRDGEWGRATAYSLGSLVLGLVGVLAGFRLALLLLQRR